jgi:hypothetical protein
MEASFFRLTEVLRIRRSKSTVVTGAPRLAAGGVPDEDGFQFVALDNSRDPREDTRGVHFSTL